MFGEALQKQVEDRLKFYENGDLPPKNAEVMHDAVNKSEEAKKKILKREKKKKKKEKKDMDVDGEEPTNGHNGSFFTSISSLLNLNCLYLLSFLGHIEENLQQMEIQSDQPQEEEEAPKKKKKKKSEKE